MREGRAICSETRLVDYGIELYTVRQDDSGIPIRLNGPRVVSVRPPDRFGGMFDTQIHQWVGESENPVVWFCSEAQRPLLVGDGTPLQLLVEGGEGAGKTAILARWLALQAVLRMGEGLEYGCTAPTRARLQRVHQALKECMPEEWYSYRERDNLYTLGNGAHAIRLVSSHQQSEAAGSPVQGYDWGGGAMDELQDQIERVEDVRSRGRRAEGGRFPMLTTATFKSTPAYRTFRDKWKSGKNSGIRTLTGYSNAYVEREFWDNRRGDLTDREFRRRVLSEDVGPERQTYYSWSREHNLRPIPRIGAEPITEQVLSRWGSGFALLGGHDPGQIYRVSLLAKIYRIVGITRPCYWIVDEVTTQETTTEGHVKVVLERLRKKWHTQQVDWKGRPAMDQRRVLFRADPWTDVGNDAKRPDKVVYTHFKKAGLRILPARLKSTIHKVSPMQIPKDSGIEMVNTLLCNADFERRLFVDCDENREPCAPKLVEAFEMSQRDTDGKAETQKKDADDLSHWPATLRYMLWELEKPREFENEEEAA